MRPLEQSHSEREDGNVGAGGWGRREWELVFDGERVWDEGKVLETDGDVAQCECPNVVKPYA